MNEYINNSSITNYINEYMFIIKECIYMSSIRIEGNVTTKRTNVEFDKEAMAQIKMHLSKLDSTKIKLVNMNNESTCENCNGVMIFDANKNQFACGTCNNVSHTYEVEPVRNVTPYHYAGENISKSITKELNRILGRAFIDVSQSFIDKFRAYRQRHYNKKEFTYDDYRTILKALKEPKYYAYIPYLMSKIDNVILPNPTYEEFLTIIEKTKNIIIIFNENKCNKGRNNLNRHYAIRKSIVLLYRPGEPNYNILRYINKQNVKTAQEKEANYRKVANLVN